MILEQAIEARQAEEAKAVQTFGGTNPQGI